jgi:hypothetical protein
MLRSLFGKRKKKPAQPSSPLRAAGDMVDSIENARVGDEVAIVGLTEGYDEAFREIQRRDKFTIERVNRYRSDGGEWYELVGVSEDRNVRIEWADEGGLFVTVTPDTRPMSLPDVGLTESELIRMDEEHSIDNSVIYGGKKHFYRNSHEVSFFQDGLDEEDGFYAWDFVSEDMSRVLSVVKWEGAPFEVFISEVVPPENITVYKS